MIDYLNDTLCSCIKMTHLYLFIFFHSDILTHFILPFWSTASILLNSYYSCINLKILTLY